ncbi:hypothetical protein SAMN06309945_1766 [Okibacterium fritillariae]|uniref:Uncharacterized protein n=1 Tax=Okibacterium fritillariae TaxID=123320 RepID=A0A1T5JQF1_9MICO|nr:hypothetical protein SAMN06309945_1766 [Okibacterium fritillariae]
MPTLLDPVEQPAAGGIDAESALLLRASVEKPSRKETQ